MDIPKSAISLRLRCKSLYRSWWITHYTVGLMGIVCAAVLTAISTPIGTTIEGEQIVQLSAIRPNAWLLGVVATICGSLVTLLGPIQKAEMYWSAYHLLDQAILELDNDIISMKLFTEKVASARKVLKISDVSDILIDGSNKSTGLVNEKDSPSR